MSSTEPVHSESEKDPWSVNVADHPARADSPEYVAARQKMNEIATGATGLIYGSPPYQDHHGGALWFKDGQGWFLVRNVAGIEWSAQWCADPAKVDLLRQNAKRLYDLLQPQIKQELDPGGLLDTPITDAPGVAKWTDSIFNAGVPLQPTFHTGVLPANAPPPAGQEPGGVHHYPTPIAATSCRPARSSSRAPPRTCSATRTSSAPTWAASRTRRCRVLPWPDGRGRPAGSCSTP